MHALLGRPGTEGFLEASVEPWITAIAGRLAGRGRPGHGPRRARLGLAVARGLLLDLLATGDRAGVTEAYERYLRLTLGNEDELAAGPVGGVPDLADGQADRSQ